MSNTFNLKDLKTGMKLTMSDPFYDDYPQYIVLRDTTKGDCLVSTEKCSWNPLSHISFYGEILKVEVSQAPFNLKGTVKWETIWERPAKETPEQAKQRELREQYENTKKQLEELGKQLGIE